MSKHGVGLGYMYVKFGQFGCRGTPVILWKSSDDRQPGP